MLFNKMRGILARFTIAIMLAATLATGTSTGAYAADPPTEPAKLDASGCDRDGFTIEYRPGVHYFAENDPNTAADDVELPAGFYSAGCASSYLIRTTYPDAQNFIVPGPNFRLTYSSAVTGTEATNQYQALVGACNPLSTKTEVKFSFLNVADNSGRYVQKMLLGTVRTSDKMGSALLFTANVFDGETRQMGTQYMVSGWHEVQVSYDEQPYVTLSPPIYVPPCGELVIPPSLARPKGSIDKIGPYTVRVNAVNLGVTTRTTFRLFENPVRGKTVVKTFKVNFGKVVTRVVRGKAGTRYALKVKTTKAKAAGKKKWRVVARATLRSR